METQPTVQSSFTINEPLYTAKEIILSLVAVLVAWLLVTPFAIGLQNANLVSVFAVVAYGLLFAFVVAASYAVLTFMRLGRFQKVTRSMLEQIGYKNVTFKPGNCFTASNRHGNYVRGSLCRIDMKSDWAREHTYAIVEF